MNVIKKMIMKKVNPQNVDLSVQYKKTLKLFKVAYPLTAKEDELKKLLYEFNCKKLEQAINKMSSKKKKKLASKLEKSLDQTVLEDLRKIGKKGAITGSGILALQGGAILITGSNLGICMLLTTGLSGLSGILGISFPFAAYITAGIIGGKIIAVGGFFANPWVAIPLIGLSMFSIYKRAKNKQYINLAGINYLIESKRALGI